MTNFGRIFFKSKHSVMFFVLICILSLLDYFDVNVQLYRSRIGGYQIFATIDIYVHYALLI